MKTDITTSTPHGTLPNSHIIIHFKVDTITYKEPTLSPKLRIEPRIEGHAIHILCIHHQNKSIGSGKYIQQINDIANILQIPAIFKQFAPPTTMVT